MKELRATVLVGLLAVVSVGLVILGVVNTNRGIGSDDDTYTVFALFDDSTGIAAGTKVTIAGFPVGQVETVKLVGAVVRVTLRLRKGVILFSGTRKKREDGSEELTNAAMLTRLQASLLGDYYLEITPGASGKMLAEGDEVPIVVTTTAIQATLDRLETAAKIIPKIDQIAGDVAKVTANAAKVFGGEEGATRFDEISENLVETSRELSRTTMNVRKRLEQGPLAPGGELDQTVVGLKAFTDKANGIAVLTKGSIDRATASAFRSLDNVEAVTRNVRDIVGRNTEGLEDTVGNLRSTLARLEGTLQRLDQVMATIEKVADKTAQGQGTVGRLLTDDSLIRDVEATVFAAKDLMTRFTGSEMGIDFRTAYYTGLHGKPEGLRGNGDFPVTPWRSQLSLRIQPNKDKYYLLSVSSDIYNNSYVLGRTTLSAKEPAAPNTLNETITEVDDNVKFGFQYVRRWGAIAVRGGLIESRAGFGADVFAFGDRVQIGVDVFRLTSDLLPRVRSTLVWSFLPWAYIHAGGDDLLEKGRRDIFFGAGLSFTDNDLMLLIMGTPTVQFK